MQCFVPGPHRRRFGWQFQGDQFRLVGITAKSESHPRARREQIMQTSHLDYFDFSLPSQLAGALTESRSRKQWCGYEPDFVYRYQTLEPDITWRRFVELAGWFTSRTLDHVAR